MLPDFLLPLPIRQRAVVARDVATCVFFADFPDDVPFTACFEAAGDDEQHRIVMALHQWVDAVLSRVLVRPAFSLGTVRRLGADREGLMVAYCHAVGVVAAPATGEPPLPPRQTLRPAPADRPRPSPDLGLLAGLPGPNVSAAVRLLASKVHEPPHRLWREWTISAFAFSWRVLLQKALLERATPRRD